MQASAVAHGDGVVVFGGARTTQTFATLWIFDFTTSEQSF
jgi:hypothetical protein